MPSFLLCVETTTKSRVGHTTECNYQQKKNCVVWLDLFLNNFLKVKFKINRLHKYKTNIETLTSCS